MSNRLPLAPSEQPARPPLPRPERRRWQPLRLGLVELFHFDSEEFWFRDGHLLLRGNNGTGKSKVLSLTLPFLLDAQTKSSRIEPDGDSSKRMAWNLLLGVQERRTGYAWIEFGRRDADGCEHFLTLGAGLFAAAARSHVESWYFIIEDGKGPLRIGENLWLVSDQGVVLSKERLRERLQGAGLVFENASSYRRAVDERLFHLGRQRYDALIDTLIQLRQPQLSKKPDERLLSDALSEALPPLSPDLLTDVADALSQLEEDRRQLDRYQRLRQAVQRFNQRYRNYTSLQSRRQARAVRQAQTEFDNASQERNAALARVAACNNEESKAVVAHESAEAALTDAVTRLEVLRDDPANEDGTRLDNAARDAEARERAHTAAAAALGEVTRRLERDSAETKRLDVEALRSEQALLDARASAIKPAAMAGVTVHADSAFLAWQPSALAVSPPAVMEAMARDLRHALAERRAHIETVRRRLDEVQRADVERQRRLDLRDERQDEMTDAEARRMAADEAASREGMALIEAWQHYLESLVHIPAPAREQTALVEELAAWAGTLDGANPARLILQDVHQAAISAYAARKSELRAEQATLETESSQLDVERRRLVDGIDIAPPAPPARNLDARTERAGAPFWQVVDFKEAVAAPVRAGLEAALEASGLLDAWVDPSGRIEASDGSSLLDARVVARPVGRDTLAAILMPSLPEGCPVMPAHIDRLLAGIVCSREDPGDSESWIGIDGRFRLGALSGAWAKNEASYIGYAARKTARERRLVEIDDRLAELAASLGRIATELSRLDVERAEAEREWQRQPGDDRLRSAHATATAAAQDVSRVRERLAEAERVFSATDQAANAARERLKADAADLRLPTGPDDLSAVSSAVEECRDAFDLLAQSAREVRRAIGDAARQRQRESETREDHAGRQSDLGETLQAAREAAARLDVLQRSIGAKVDEIRRQIESARQKRTACETARNQAADTLTKARMSRAVADEQEQTAASIFEKSSAARKAAVDTFQRFVATGMLASALPEATIPDLASPWTIDPALNLARRVEQALANVNDDDATWARVQKEVTSDLNELQGELSSLGERAQPNSTDWGIVVHILYQNRPEHPDRLIMRLTEEIDARSKLLTSRERDILENHLQAEIAAEIQRLLQTADAQRQRINAELYQRPTATGVRYRLLWQPLSEDEGAPSGFEVARKRLLATNTELWTAEDRGVIGRMLQSRITAERERADAEGSSGSLVDLLSHALDYRRWHRFRIERLQAGDWRKLSGPASSGERALGLTVPLFAAVASFYGHGDDGATLAPRLILLDEAFAGIDDQSRKHCMALIREFDLDFVITSEREWACYAELPGVSICQLQRREGIDAVYVSRWTWDGVAPRPMPDPDRRVPA